MQDASQPSETDTDAPIASISVTSRHPPGLYSFHHFLYMKDSQWRWMAQGEGGGGSHTEEARIQHNSSGVCVLRRMHFFFTWITCCLTKPSPCRRSIGRRGWCRPAAASPFGLGQWPPSHRACPVVLWSIRRSRPPVHWGPLGAPRLRGLASPEEWSPRLPRPGALWHPHTSVRMSDDTTRSTGHSFKRQDCIRCRGFARPGYWPRDLSSIAKWCLHLNPNNDHLRDANRQDWLHTSSTCWSSLTVLDEG